MIKDKQIVMHRSEMMGFEWGGCNGGQEDYEKRCRMLGMKPDDDSMEIAPLGFQRSKEADTEE